MADQRLNIVFSADGSQLTKTIGQLEAELKGFQSQLKGTLGADEFNRLNKSIASTKEHLSLLRSGSVATGQALKGFAGGANAATQSMINLGRVVQDAPFGFLGIANNLNPLLESFQRLKATTGSTGGALKALGSSLLGAGGLGFALSVVSSLLIVFGDRIFGAGKKAKQAESEVKSFNLVVSDSAASVQGDIAKVGALVKIATDTANSFKIQSDAISALKKLNKDYFGELKAGVSTYEDITKAANAYTDSLVNQAIVNGLSNAINKLAEEAGNALIEYQRLTKVTNDARIALNATKAANATVVQGLTAQNAEVNKAQNSYNKLEISLFKAGKAYGSILTRINEFKNQLQGAVFEQIKFTPDVNPDKIKESINKLQGIINLSASVKIPAELNLSFKEDLKTITDKLFSGAGILGTQTKKIISGIVPGASEDVKKRNDAFFEAYQNNIKVTADLISGTLSPAFEGMFDAILKGENPLKAFFKGLVDSINQVIKKLIQAVIQAAVLSALSGGVAGGGTSFIGALGSILGLKKGSIAAPSFGRFGQVGSQALIATVRGTDLAFVLQQGQNSINRVR